MIAYRCRLSRIASPYIALAFVWVSSPGCEATIGPPSAIEGDGGQPVADASGRTLDAGDGSVTSDGSTGIDAPPAFASCDDIYSDVPAYELCLELDDRCLFNAATAGGSCADVCAQVGGMCIEAYDNDPGAPCIGNQLETCDVPRDDEICVCTRI